MPDPTIPPTPDDGALPRDPFPPAVYRDDDGPRLAQLVAVRVAALFGLSPARTGPRRVRGAFHARGGAA